MKILKTKLEDVLCIEPTIHGDHRGFFTETWRNSWFEELGLNYHFVQDNHSMSVKGTLRGLHYQIKQPQGKLVRVIKGEVYDVAVDLRKDSPNFGEWIGATLSSENKKILWIPPGFAHGFLVLSEQAEFVYKCTTYYQPEHDRTLLWNDPEIGITWPEMSQQELLLSDKDKQGKQLNEAEVF